MLAVPAAALLLLLAACTASQPAHPVVPTVTWTAGTSPLESDPVVKAARAADLATAIAINVRDFSRADLRRSTTPAYLDQLYQGTVRNYPTERPVVRRGPSIWLPVQVTPTAQGADLLVCDASRDWYLEQKDHPVAVLHDDQGIRLTVKLTRSGAGFRVDDEIPTTTPCDATGAPVGRFVPAPRPPASLQKSDIIPPRGEK